MKPCSDFALLISLRAADALEPEDASHLDAHLATCERCRVELAATTAALGLARLPAPTRAERRVLADLPDRLIREVRSDDRRRGVARRLAVVGAVAAAFLFALVIPSGLRDHPSPPPRDAEPTTVATAASTPAASAWKAPDMDTLWQETDLVDFAGDGADDNETAYTTAAYGGDPY